MCGRFSIILVLVEIISVKFLDVVSGLGRCPDIGSSTVMG